MPSRHRSPLLGWHCPAELAAWARTEAERRGVPLSAILTEALAQYMYRVNKPRRPVPLSVLRVADAQAAEMRPRRDGGDLP